MKNRTLLALAALLLMLSVSASFAQITAVPNSMNFQGRLAKPDGTPVPNGTYSIRFSLWNIASGGTPAANEKWNKTAANVSVKNGVFAVTLDAFPANLFNGTLWLEIKIGADAALTPRQPLVTVAYAFKAGSVVDGAVTGASIANATITNAKIAAGTLTADKFASNIFNPLVWLLGGNSGTNPATQFLGTSDNQPLAFRANNRQVMRFEDVKDVADTYHTVNVLGGAAINHIEAGVLGATIAGGGLDSNAGSDNPNDIRGNFGVISGGSGNFIDAFLYGTIAGGTSNNLQGNYASISGGFGNNVQSDYGVIGGGTGNYVFGSSSIIAGGELNSLSGSYGAIGGGNFNSITGGAATIGGGQSNAVSNIYATVGGGYSNTSSGQYATVAGGGQNIASGFIASVGGGGQNKAIGEYAAVGGGLQNSASGNHATIGGGTQNSTGAEKTVIGGGDKNYAGATWATVGGGLQNWATGLNSFVGGGYINQAAATYSMVPGGYNNYAGGIASFAAGYRAIVGYEGSFVWADAHEADFASSAANQFSIRAYGGMVFEANGSMPLYTSATSGEKNRYLFLLNSPQTSTASGLKAGGILCADSYGYANPGKNDLIVKGTLSVGYNFSPTNYIAAFNGSIYTNGSYASSDVRFKKNITSLDKALDNVLNLRGVSYEWDREKFPNQNFGAGKQMGFIAQEIEKVFPELVMTAPDGYKAVNYVGVVPVLVEAVKTLHARTVLQQKQLDARDKKIAEMEAKLDALVTTVRQLQNNPK